MTSLLHDECQRDIPVVIGACRRHRQSQCPPAAVVRCRQLQWPGGSGRREVAIYDRRDPDACTAVPHLSQDDVRDQVKLQARARDFLDKQAAILEAEGKQIGVVFETFAL